MRIVIATGIYPPQIGGPATYAHLLYTQLPRFGFTVSVVNFGEVLTLPKIIRHIFYFFRLCQVSWRADYIVALDPVSVGLPALLVSKIFRKKLILKIVGDYAWEQFMAGRYTRSEFVTPIDFQNRRYGFVTEVRRSIEHFVARRATKIIVPSQFLKTLVLQWGVRSENIILIYNAFAPESLVENSDTQTLQSKIILTAGRLVPWKGIEVLLRVFREIRTNDAAVLLYIVGDGPDRHYLQSLTQSLGLAHSVHFLGSLNRAEFLSQLKKANLFVLNSGYEGFSHVLLEAAACGTPIVTTDVGGNSEFIEHNVSGLLVVFNDQTQLADAISELLKDSAKAKQLAVHAQLKLGEFTEERMFQSLITLFT